MNTWKKKVLAISVTWLVSTAVYSGNVSTSINDAGGNVTVGDISIPGATDRNFNVAGPNGLVNLIRTHDSFPPGVFLKWQPAAGTRQHWFFGIDQTVGGGGFSVMDRLSGDARRLAIHPNGNVGIGTVNPTSKLSVNGGIQAKEIVVESGWADYVFLPDYKLSSLEEIDEYISSHGHLPGMPTAQDIEKNGVNLAEANRLLLEKVEELTLHLIELNNKIKPLQDALDKQL